MSTTEEVRERFEWDAKNFDSIYRASGSPLGYWANRVLRKAIFERFRLTFEQAGNLEGKRVLDIGCGSGVYCSEFVRRGASEVVGVDFSAPMLDLARSEVAAHGGRDKCRFIAGDFIKVDVGEEKFDVSIAMGVYDYLPDPQPFLTRMASVTRGKALASFPSPSGVRGAARRLRYRLTGRGDVYFYTEDRVRQLAERAGFKRVTLIPIDAAFSGSGWVLVGSNEPG